MPIIGDAYNASMKKVYTSGMSGMIQLNEFGDIVTVLDACLVNGTNIKEVIEYNSYYNNNRQMYEFELGAGHGFNTGDVIRVFDTDMNSEIDQSDWEQKDFKITHASNTFIEFVGPYTSNQPISATTLKVKIAPLGFEKIYGDVYRGAYRSLSTNSTRNILRVDNSVPVGYNATWAKFARVTVCDSLIDFDTYGSTNIAPYDSSNPTKNDGDETAGIAGWHKWYSNLSSGIYSKESDTTINKDVSWVLIGDERGFYFMINNKNSAYMGRTCYAFDEIHSDVIDDRFNNLLIADDNYISATANGPYQSASQLKHEPLKMNNNIGKLMFKSYTRTGYHAPVEFMTFATTMSGVTQVFPYPNPADNSLILNDVYVKENGIKRGTLRGLKAIVNGNGDGAMPDMLEVEAYPYKYLIVNIAASQTSTGAYAFESGYVEDDFISQPQLPQ